MRSDWRFMKIVGNSNWADRDRLFKNIERRIHPSTTKILGITDPDYNVRRAAALKCLQEDDAEVAEIEIFVSTMDLAKRVCEHEIIDSTLKNTIDDMALRASLLKSMRKTLN